jgi:FMN phosphatase YigB (HAD superfamily)
MLDLPAAACVFIDDQPGNIDAAKALGMQGIVFRDNPSCIAALTRLLATP